MRIKSFATIARHALLIAAFLFSISAHAQVTLNLTAGWNLVGNCTSAAIDVATTFVDAAKINSVWTWNKTAGKWAFYSPSMTSMALTTYAQSKGYDALTSIASKEGFWVNATAATSLSLPGSSSAKLAESDLQVGWNLVSSADYRTPSQLNQILSSNLNAAGKTIVSAWSWDKKNSKWKLFSSSMEAQGGSVLSDYVSSRGYLPFTSASTLSATDGYWVNVGTVTPSVTTRKAGLYDNYAKVGYYSDDMNRDDVFMRKLIDRFQLEGYTGVLFEITIGVSSEGMLQNNLQYDKLLSFIDYAHSIGLSAAIMPNWNLNGGNADYIGEGQALPNEFKMDNFFDAVKEFYAIYAGRFESHKLDILYVARSSPDFFAPKYYGNWKVIVDALRKNYKGALTYSVFSTTKYRASSIVDSISIWDLLDAISFVSWPYVSETPIYAIDEIISGYYSSRLNSSSFISEVISAARKYKLPVLLTTTVMSLDNALDGGWDPTNEQFLKDPPPTNPALQAIAYKAFFQAVNNNLYPYVTGLNIGNYEPWAVFDISSPPKPNKNYPYLTMGYFDLSNFPNEAGSAIRQYLSNPSSYNQTKTIRAGIGDDVIYVKTGNNTIYLNGGYDEVNAGDGDDQIVVSTVSGISPTSGISGHMIISFAGWFSSADNGRTYPVDVYLGTSKIASSSVAYDPIKSSSNPNGYWSDSVSLTIPIPTGSDLSKIQITMPGNAGGFVEVKSLSIDYFGNKVIDPKSASHSMGAMLTGDTKQPQPQWVYNNDVTTYDLTSLNLSQRTATTSGKFTYIDGGDGSDTIEFDPPQGKSYFQISKSDGLTVITDPKGFYPQVRMKNVEWIKFDDGTFAVQ